MSHFTQSDRLLSVMELRNVKTRSELASALGVTPGAITQLEKRGEVTKLMALACEAAYRVNAHWILTGEGEIEAPQEIALDLRMRSALLYRLPEMQRKMADQLASVFFDHAYVLKEQAEKSVQWLCRGEAHSAEVTALRSDFEAAARRLARSAREVSLLLWSPNLTEIDPKPWGDFAFTRESIAPLCHRIFVDCATIDLRRQWEDERALLSDEHQEAVRLAYEYAASLKTEAERLFRPADYARGYAEAVLYDLDPNSEEVFVRLTDALALQFWRGVIGAESLYKNILC